VEYVYFSIYMGSSNQASLGLKGGSRRVKWKSVTKHPEWYIGRAFLLPKKSFDNPSRLGETTLRAYWEHWFDLSSSGEEFTFKRTSPPHGAAGGDRNSDSETRKKAGTNSEDSDSESEKKTGKEDSIQGESDSEQEKDSQSQEDQDGPTPDQCHTDQEKIDFLHSLCQWSNDYQVVVGAIAKMKVGFC
jgi:hypothetical protein